MTSFKPKLVICLDGKPLKRGPLRPLNYSEKRLLSAIEANPGYSRSELAQLLYQAHGTHRTNALRKVSSKVNRLLQWGLVELDVIREGGRAGVQGVYLVGKSRPVRPGYAGVFGWVGRSNNVSKEHG